MSFVGMTSISVNVYWPDSMINKQTRTVHLKFYCCSSFHCPLIFSECLRFENSSWDFLSFTLVPGIFSGFASNPRDFLGVNCYDPIRTSPSLLIQSIPLSIHPPPLLNYVWCGSNWRKQTASLHQQLLEKKWTRLTWRSWIGWTSETTITMWTALCKLVA